MDITDYQSLPKSINIGITSARQKTMLSLLGHPRKSYDQKCRPVTNTQLKRLIVTDSVGPFRVTGLKPAIESLQEVMNEIQTKEPEVYNALGTVGMLCARFVRGSKRSISNHSWGTAVDLTLNGKLDTRGDNRVQVGLTKIAPIFNKYGWFWGAGFRTEDSMHFEVGEDKIRQWYTEGLLTELRNVTSNINTTLSMGDRGPDVKELQKKLNEHGADLIVDGDFGYNTYLAVMEFQGSNGLHIDGIVGPKTLGAL